MIIFRKKSFKIVAALTLFLASCNTDDEENRDCMEEKKDNCVVTFELNPVCGCNGITYENPSTAKCNGIDDYTIGECN